MILHACVLDYKEGCGCPTFPHPCWVSSPQPSAQQLAEQEMRRLQELAQEEQAERQEQLEKARLRGNHALRVEQLTQVGDLV